MSGGTIVPAMTAPYSTVPLILPLTLTSTPPVNAGRNPMDGQEWVRLNSETWSDSSSNGSGSLVWFPSKLLVSLRAATDESYHQHSGKGIELFLIWHSPRIDLLMAGCFDSEASPTRPHGGCNIPAASGDVASCTENVTLPCLESIRVRVNSKRDVASSQ